MADYGDDVTHAVARHLAALREARGWSLGQVADAANMHKSTVHLIEQGKRGMTIAAASRLAQALGVRLGDVVARAEAEVERSG